MGGTSRFRGRAPPVVREKGLLNAERSVVLGSACDRAGTGPGDIYTHTARESRRTRLARLSGRKVELGPAQSMPHQLSAVVRLQHQFVESVGVAVAVVKDLLACGVGADGQAEQRSGGLVPGKVHGGHDLAARGDL